MPIIEVDRLAAFVHTWLRVANEKDIRETPEIFYRGRVSVITTNRPDSQTDFIIDFTMNKGAAAEIYQVTACGSTFIARVGVTEPDAEGVIGLDVNLRDERVLNTADLLRVLGTYKASVHNAMETINFKPKIDLDISFSGDLRFEEELLIVAKRIKGMVSLTIPPNCDLWMITFDCIDGYQLGVMWEGDSWTFNLHNKAGCVALFGTHPSGKLMKDPQVAQAYTRTWVIERLHGMLEPMRIKLTEEHPTLKHHRLL